MCVCVYPLYPLFTRRTQADGQWVRSLAASDEQQGKEAEREDSVGGDGAKMIRSVSAVELDEWHDGLTAGVECDAQDEFGK